MEPEREQTNWRIRTDLTRGAKMLALELGVHPRDVVESALELHIASLRPRRPLTTGPLPPAAEAIVATTEHEGGQAPKGAAAAMVNVAPILAELARGCPECGGDVEPHPERADVGRCRDCGTLVEAGGDA